MPQMPPSRMPSTKNRLRNVAIAVTLLPSPSLQIHDRRSFAPQSLQPVKLALHRPENVHNDIAEIQQAPAAVRASLTPPRAAMKLGHFVCYRRCNRLNLTGITSRTDDEIIGDDGELTNVQEDNIDCFLV